MKIHTSLSRIRDRNLVSFVPWGPASLQVVPSHKSPYISTSHKVSGLMMANHTSITSVSDELHPRNDMPLIIHLSLQSFKRIIEQYDRLRKRNAFMDMYKKEKMFENGLEEFDNARWAFTSCVAFAYFCVLVSGLPARMWWRSTKRVKAWTISFTCVNFMEPASYPRKLLMLCQLFRVNLRLFELPNVCIDLLFQNFSFGCMAFQHRCAFLKPPEILPHFGLYFHIWAKCFELLYWHVLFGQM